MQSTILLDRNAFFLAGLRRTLEPSQAFEIKGVSQTQEGALTLVADAKPAVILTGLNLVRPDNAASFIAALHERSPASRIVAFLTPEHDPEMSGCLQAAGAALCLSRYATPEELAAALN